MIKIAEITDEERENVRRAVIAVGLSRGATSQANKAKRHGGPNDLRIALHNEINSRKVDINKALFIKSDADKMELKLAKRAYKTGDKTGRDEVLKAFVESKIPNWNIKFTLNN